MASWRRENWSGGVEIQAEEAPTGQDIEANEVPVLKFFVPEQAKRLRQIVWQQRRRDVLTTPKFADALRLTRTRKNAFTPVIEDEREEMLSHPPGKHGDHRPGPEGWKHSDDFWKGVNERLMSVLSEEQKAKWKDLTGEPFQGEIRFGPPSSAGPRPHDHPPMEWGVA